MSVAFGLFSLFFLNPHRTFCIASQLGPKQGTMLMMKLTNEQLIHSNIPILHVNVISITQNINLLFFIYQQQ